MSTSREKMIIEGQGVITHHYSYYAFQHILLINTSITQIYFNHHGTIQGQWINVPETAAIARLGPFDEHIIPVLISLQAAAGYSAAAAVAYASAVATHISQIAHQYLYHSFKSILLSFTISTFVRLSPTPRPPSLPAHRPMAAPADPSLHPGRRDLQHQQTPDGALVGCCWFVTVRCACCGACEKIY